MSVETIKAEEFYTSKVDGAKDRYLIEYPAYAVTGPLVLYLHTGLADADQGFCDSYVFCANKLKDEVIGRGGIFVAPDYRGDSWMKAAVEADIAGLIRELEDRFGDRPVVMTGTSMGGTCALIFASLRPEIVDGVVALCPASDMRKLWREFTDRNDPAFQKIADCISDSYGGTPDEVPEEYAVRSSIEHVDRLNMPIVICHGDSDEILSVMHSRNLVEALLAAGRQVRFDEISGGVHMSPAVETPWREYLDLVLALSSSSPQHAT